MFDVGASEMLMIIIVAVVVIGPKDMPMALRTAGRWIGKMRRISGHFRSGLDAMVREAELEEMERKWREQNEAIMKSHPQLASSDPMTGEPSPPHPTSAEAALASLDAPAGPYEPGSHEPGQPLREAEPQLPLPPP
jgi:sec-independent protein translocase protein TatB